ncbi:MAG TPA: hypothetical protein VET85_06045 [Stellaceae bacterium]|nr:hypothetical protein [Stellaceae bacterium]
MTDAWFRARGCAAIAVLLVLGVVPARAEDRRVGAEALCVTNGAVSARPDGKLAIETPSSRGWVRGSDGQSAEIRFRYLGPSSGTKPLASGELRRQIGIKLHAQDTCNLLYVMWHIEPDSRIAVSIKRNPNQHTHAECHANGYTTLKPSIAMPQVVPGEAHSLRAELRGGELTVLADGRRAWVGSIGGGLAGIEGPAGFRTDNARFEFEYFAKIADAVGPPRGAEQSRDRCVQQPGD